MPKIRDSLASDRETGFKPCKKHRFARKQELDKMDAASSAEHLRERLMSVWIMLSFLCPWASRDVCICDNDRKICVSRDSMLSQSREGETLWSIVLMESAGGASAR